MGVIQTKAQAKAKLFFRNFKKINFGSDSLQVLEVLFKAFEKVLFLPKMAYQGPQKVQKVMVQPINLIFRFLQNRTRVQVWLYENVNTRIEGHIVGFDEYMNLVLDDAAEVHLKRGTMKKVGRIMLKGDNITLIQSMDGKSGPPGVAGGGGSGD